MIPSARTEGHEASERRALNGVAGLAGALLVGYGLFGLDAESTFPGVNALFPCAGTALLILSGRGNASWVSRLLKFKPLVWVGLISYSLYLWHWPILAFVRYFAIDLNAVEGLCVVAVIFLVSIASYRWVELPFRSGRIQRGDSALRVLATYSVSTIALGVVSFLVVRSDGFGDAGWNTRYRNSLSQLQQRTQPALKYPYNCQSSKFYPDLFDAERCVIKPRGSNERVDMILLGDSNAAHYIGVLGAIGERYGFSFRNVSLSSCPPILGDSARYGNKADRAPCAAYRATIMNESDRYQYVVLGAQWSSHGRQKRFKSDLKKTIAKLRGRGKQVILLGMVPRFNSYGLECEARRLRLPLIDCEYRSGQSPYLDDAMNGYLRKFAASDSGVFYMDVSSVLCPGGVCRPYLDGKPVYYDAGHLSMVGSWEIGNKMLENPEGIPGVFKRL